MEQVKLYDSTLRDGMGGRGMSLSVGEKVSLARALDALGVDFIEAGFPSSNPKELELFERLAELELRNATIAAFGMTRRRGVEAEADAALVALADSFAPVICLVGKSSPFHVEKVIRVSREENLAMIAESIALCRDHGKRPVFDAEHFFDGYREDPAYALECVRAAAAAGAENVTLCDTNGGSLPSFVATATATVVEALDGVEVGIHTHNDSECAVANSLAAVEAGARLVQGCVNGYGERCGNANLASILPSLQLKMGFEVVSPEQLAGLTETAHYLDELCNLVADGDRPYVGRNAFAHKAGMHAAGVAVDPSTFEHIDPALVGNDRDILPSELAGRATVRSRAEQAGLELDDEATARAVERLKEREHAGYHFEAAPASFELLLRRETGAYEPLFVLESYRVVTERRAGGEVETEATIKVEVDGQRYLRVAEGNGPVNALDNALRSAITVRYPHLAEIELTNYKVRILDQDHGTGAVTRVILDSADQEREWGTTGVSENIIEASWQALVDSLEYAFQPRAAAGEAAQPALGGASSKS
jgi:2-isopropylmalate synthase